MFSKELKTILDKQLADSTTFWAGKPKLNEKELEAVAAYAKKKGDAIDKALPPDLNLESLIQTAINKK